MADIQESQRDGSGAHHAVERCVSIEVRVEVQIEIEEIKPKTAQDGEEPIHSDGDQQNRRWHHGWRESCLDEFSHGFASDVRNSLRRMDVVARRLPL
ncbi:MAG: hypothetical protein ABI619_11685 [Betaproteobacteria bacterium]